MIRLSVKRRLSRTETAPSVLFGMPHACLGVSLYLSAQRIGPDDTLQVSVEITNPGGRAGKEVVQMYLRDVLASLQRPEKEFKGFAKIHLEPGEYARLELL